MLLGFKQQFAPYILDGSKRHTIRANRKIEPRVGEICHNYTGLRQKGATLLGRWPCVRVRSIRISLRTSHVSPLLVFIDGIKLQLDETEALFYADGFRTGSGHSFPATSEAALFWRASLAKQDFDGVIIHWDFDNPVTEW